MGAHFTFDYDDATLADAVVALADGGTAALPGGVTLRLTLEADDIDPFDDTVGAGEWCGRIAWRDNRRAQRPDGFDGNAEVVRISGDAYWWQPGADAPTRGTDEFAHYRRTVLDLAETGYAIALLDVEIGRDATRRPIVAGRSVLGGIGWDGMDPSYLRDMVEDALRDADQFGPLAAAA